MRIENCDNGIAIIIISQIIMLPSKLTEVTYAILNPASLCTEKINAKWKQVNESSKIRYVMLYIDL